MYESLEEYIEKISQYLAVKRGGEEILAEIRSHILEKAEEESGTVTEESLRRAIAEYGRPREVAEKYIEGSEIISPTLRKHLFRYTWILFAFHFAVTALAVYWHVNIVAIPFFFIPKMSVYWALVYLPMALVYDFGLVALALYLVTQKKRDAQLPWPRFLRAGTAGLRLGQPKFKALVIHLAYFAGILYVLIRFHTILFYSMNFGKPVSLLAPVPALFYSTLLVAALGCHAVAYAVRFLVNSAWVYVVRDAVILILLWTIWNSPIKPEFKEVRGFDLHVAGSAFILVLAVLAAVRFLRNIQRVRREMTLS
jgi:hypothetical protein